MSLLKVGIVQQSCTDQVQANLATSLEAICKLAREGARLVVLQELHASLYFCQQESEAAFDLAEPIPGPTTEALGKVAREQGVVIVASVFERRTAGLYHNTAVVIEQDGSLAGRYRKMHIPDDPGYYEKYYFTPGDLGFQPIQTSVGKLGVLICWDQWFPEAARLMATAGAELLIYPTAIGWSDNEAAEEQRRQHQAWITIQRSHAIANGLPVVAVNRVGYEENPAGGPGIRFWGSSFVAGPQGELLYEASESEPEQAVVPLDLRRTEAVRRAWPYLRDRRVDGYQDLQKLYRD